MVYLFYVYIEHHGGCGEIKKLHIFILTASSKFGTYRLCEQRRFRRACASAQSRQNLHCSLIQVVNQEEPSDRKSDPWPLWMAGHAQLKFVMTECSKTQIRFTGLILREGINISIVMHHSWDLQTCTGLSIWAATWQNKQSDCVPSEDSEQPGHPPRVFAVSLMAAKDPCFLHADSEDSDQTGRMPRLIWVFAGRTVILLVLSCRGSFVFNAENMSKEEASAYLCKTKWYKCHVVRC